MGTDKKYQTTHSHLLRRNNIFPSYSRFKMGASWTDLNPSLKHEPLNKDASADEPIGTAPFDARFQNVNQIKACMANYVDFQKCVKAKGEDYKPCEFFFRNYKVLCPEYYVEKWDEAIEEGNFQVEI